MNRKVFDRFKFIIIFITAFIAFSISFAWAGQVKLQWDPNDPAPEGYRVFTRVENTLYDYTKPQPVLEFADGNILHPTALVTVDLPGLPMKAVKYYFIVRAYDGDLESEDSEEVFWTINRTPPDLVSSIQAEYNKASSEISLSFVQPNADRAKYWKVFYTFTSGSSYVEFDTIQNTGQAQPSSTKAFTAVSVGEIKTVYFVVIGFYDDESFSENSAEASVVIDRRVKPQPPINLKVGVIIPVQ